MYLSPALPVVGAWVVGAARLHRAVGPGGSRGGGMPRDGTRRPAAAGPSHPAAGLSHPAAAAAAEVPGTSAGIATDGAI